MPNNLEQLKTKTLVMLVGPTAVGKSTIMNQVVLQNADFVRVGGFTTRPPRPNDESGLYRYLEKSAAHTMIETGETLQYAVNPANGHIYGTTFGDFPGAYNMKDTLSGAVEEFRALPFGRHITLSLTVPADTWHKWLLSRYPEPGTERTNRLLEAKASIEWSLSQTTSHAWLINHSGHEQTVADEFIRLCEFPTTDQPIPTEPRNMLQMIDDLLSYG